ncbi:MAG: phosphotriesterase, partial [Actinomycetota bacterium]|nr:phosphotriesterase [Actinomycetota bacterium]
IHEHLRTRDDANAFQFPHLYDEDALYAAGVEAARNALDRGVKTIGEPTAMFLNRDVRFLERVAKETGLQAVVCTGIYTYDHLPLFWQSRSPDVMADAFVHDIEQGIQGTDIKAAFLKCAADEPGVNDNVEKVHRACARASLRTGAPIMAHSRPASNTGPRQVEIFLEEGVAPEKIQIAHCGDTDDVGYIEGLLEKGVYVGLDRFGIEMYLPMDRRLNTAAALLEKGYSERMFLSADSCATIDWFPDEMVEMMMREGAVKDWTITLVHDQVIPALRERGMTDEQLETMMVENPQRWLNGG